MTSPAVASHSFPPITDDTIYVTRALEEFNFWRRLIARLRMDDTRPRELRAGVPLRIDQLSTLETSMVLLRAQELKEKAKAAVAAESAVQP